MFSGFISAIIRDADSMRHLDVNNIYVNSQNFNFDPLAFMTALPLERTCYLHVAGHYVESDGLLIEIPHQLVRYLSETTIKQPLPRWLVELAHYEWVELDVDISKQSGNGAPA